MQLYEITMEDGHKEKVTLNMGALADVSAKNHEMWEKYNSLYKKLQKERSLTELEMAKLIYIAYYCAHVHEDEIMTETEFLHSMTDSRQEIGELFQKLYGVKEKKQGFQTPSGKQQGKVKMVK